MSMFKFIGDIWLSIDVFEILIAERSFQIHSLIKKNKVKTQLLRIKLNDKISFADYSSEIS